MPIYKISRRGSVDKRSRALYVRLRLIAVLLSLLFVGATILLLLHGGH